MTDSREPQTADSLDAPIPDSASQSAARAWLEAYGVNTNAYRGGGGDHPAMRSLPAFFEAYARQQLATANARCRAVRVLAQQIEFLRGDRKRAWNGDFVASLGAAAQGDRLGCMTCIGEAEIGVARYPHQRDLCPDCDPRAPGFARENVGA